MGCTKKSIKVSRAKFWTNSHGVLFCAFNNTRHYLTLGVDVAEKYKQAISTLAEDKPMPFLIDLRDNQGDFSAEAAKLLASSPALNKVRISEAFVINSIKTKLLISTYKRIFEPHTPFKIFNDFDEALAYSINSKKIFDAGK
ncbi:hypothetical protein [Hwangdonia sp.]|uniref:DUF7793 family protein n=1 Tax=Hwangdonia sp. TaxID=1883432 RepID=UPI003AB58C72